MLLWLSLSGILLAGSVLLLNELTLKESPGEAVAFKEVFSRDVHVIEKCRLYPSKAIVNDKVAV